MGLSTATTVPVSGSVQGADDEAASLQKKGFVVTVKKNSANKPGSNTVATDMKSGARSSLYKMKSMMVKQRYRKDLSKAALRRAALRRGEDEAGPMANGFEKED